MSRYIVGQGKAPEWVAKKLMCFRTLDGGVGWEIETGRNNTKRIYKGDIIVNKGNFVQVLRAKLPDNEIRAK